MITETSPHPWASDVVARVGGEVQCLGFECTNLCTECSVPITGNNDQCLTWGASHGRMCANTSEPYSRASHGAGVRGATETSQYVIPGPTHLR